MFFYSSYYCGETLSDSSLIFTSSFSFWTVRGFGSKERIVLKHFFEELALFTEIIHSSIKTLPTVL